MTAERTAIVVVNYGSSQLLETNLTASAAPTDLVVVVDSWTDAAERERVRLLAQRHGWLLAEPDHNTGFGGGMNLGVGQALEAGATTLLLLNPDARIAPGDVAHLAEQVQADETLLIAPRILRADGLPWMAALMDLRLADGTVGSSLRRPPGAAVMEWVSGAVMVLSAALWRRIGGFDEEYFLYWEDIDLCRRVHEVGGTIRVDTSVTAVHDEGGTHADGGGQAKSEAYYFYNIRNRALYAARWLSAEDRRRWRASTLRTAADTIQKGGRRQLIQSFRPWRAYLRGVAASLRVGVAQHPGGSVRPD